MTTPHARFAFPLHAAAASGNLKSLRRLLRAAEDPQDELARNDNQGLTPLMHAAGRRAEGAGIIEFLIGRGADALQPCTKRKGAGSCDSPFSMAIRSGNVENVRSLFMHGAHACDAGIRCEAQPLRLAIALQDLTMLRYLLSLGFDPEEEDSSGSTALYWAALSNDLEAVTALLEAGADPLANQSDRSMPTAAQFEELPSEVRERLVSREPPPYRSALAGTANGAVAVRLLRAGCDPSDLLFEARREILGLPGDQQPALPGVSIAEFEQGRERRFGAANPQIMDVPFWLAMIQSGLSGWQAANAMGVYSGIDRGPIWSAERFGQSITFLPDGRIVQIGGEHEMQSDPDYCVFNDVFVHTREGGIRIYGYPKRTFPPTDFHTATLCGDFIYVIGGLGYLESREPGRTMVHRLDLRSFAFEKVQTIGDGPGWIHGHRARLMEGSTIRVEGGLVTIDNPAPNAGEWIAVEGRGLRYKKVHPFVDRPNSLGWELDLASLGWQQIADSPVAEPASSTCEPP